MKGLVATIIVGAVVFLLIALVVIKMIWDKKNNRSSCGGGCAGCPSAGLCHIKKDEPEN